MSLLIVVSNVRFETRALPRAVFDLIVLFSGYGKIFVLIVQSWLFLVCEFRNVHGYFNKFLYLNMCSSFSVPSLSSLAD